MAGQGDVKLLQAQSPGAVLFVLKLFRFICLDHRNCNLSLDPGIFPEKVISSSSVAALGLVVNGDKSCFKCFL